MNKPEIQIAQLDKARLEKLQELEKELGVWIIALEPAIRLADLSADQLAELQAKEKELGVVLLAYQSE